VLLNRVRERIWARKPVALLNAYKAFCKEAYWQPRKGDAINGHRATILFSKNIKAFSVPSSMIRPSKQVGIKLFNGLTLGRLVVMIWLERD